VEANFNFEVLTWSLRNLWLLVYGTKEIEP
jgi:hypothetical protein